MIALAVLGLAGAQWHAWTERQAGRALFEGEGTPPLVGRLLGHEDALPTLASRCANCHAGTQAMGGLIAQGALQQLRSRRNGPPARYDEATLCRALQKGIDPAQVTLPRAMPLYEISPRQCRQLWAYLSHS